MEAKNLPLTPAGSNKAEEGSLFNLKWLVSTVLAVWPWMLGSVIISLIAGNLYLRYTTPVYRSYAELLIADPKGGSSGNNGGDIADLLKLNNRKINIDNEIEILKSRTMKLKVVSELHLNVRYSIEGRVKTTEVYANRPFDFVVVGDEQSPYRCKVDIQGPEGYRLTESNGNIIQGKWGDTISIQTGRAVLVKTTAFVPEKVEYTVAVSDPFSTAIGLGIDIYPPTKNASFISIVVLDVLPERAVDIIDKLMEVYARNNILIRNRISDSTMSFINKRIDIVDSELFTIEKGIEAFKQQHGIADMSAQAEQLVSANTTTLQNLAAQEYELSIIESVSNSLSRENEKDEKPIILPASLLGNTGLSSLLEKYETLKTEIENSMIAFTADNPLTKMLIKQRGEVRQSIISALASSKKELQLKVEKTKKELETINSDIRNIPKVERLALDYSRKQAIKQEMFIFLLKKREDAAIEKAATVSDASPIDKAITTGIVLPDRPRILMLSFIIGIAVPFGFILLRRALNVKVINKSDISNATSIPIIGEIGNNHDGKSVAVSRNSRTIVSEQFRALRTNLQYLLTDKNDKVLMITSSMSGEGKSFIATNLAITLAMAGKKVVLMEMDLRKPKISKALGIDNSVGFSTYSINKAGYEDIVVPSNIEPNLFIIPSGPIPPNPSELVLLHRTEELFHQLREKFDYIILDTSPLGLVTDAQLLYKYADTALYIVRQGHTYKQQLNIPNELYQSGKIPRISLIVNDVIANRGFSYGYGYEEGYGYGYGYGSYGGGYYTSDEKKSIWQKLRLKK